MTRLFVQPMKYSKITFILVLFLIKIQAQVLSSAEIDELSERALKSFNVPGIAVAVIKDGKVIHAKGYGVRNIATGEKVNENTFYGIASNSKAFTTAALAMLIEEKKLKWDDKVTDYLPDFKMYSPYVTEEFTIRDLVCHRSGLGLGSGDLLMWPDSTLNNSSDIIHQLRYLKPVSSFRTKYDYNNNLFIVAGEVVKVVSGMSWEDFVEKKIMQPLGMNNSAASLSRLKEKNNVAKPHAVVEGKMQTVAIGWSEVANPAGGICTNITELSKWVIAQLNKGKYGENNSKQLFTERSQNEMWSLQTIIPARTAPPYNTRFSGYGLGWVISDVKGYKQVGHTGGLAGMVTQVTLLPELNLGIIVLTNQQVGAAFSSITNSIKDAYLGLPKKDWIKENAERVNKTNAEAQHITDSLWKIVEANKTKIKVDELSNYAGKYKDNWFGDITISRSENKLLFASKRSPRMKGELHYFNACTFIVKWYERAFDADAFVNFTLDEKGRATGFKMNAFSPLTDFSFDFQDLDVYRVD